MVKRTRTGTNVSAAERRVRALAPDAKTLPDAVRHVVAELMRGVSCPPTDLAGLGRKIGVNEVAYESFAGSGELHKIKGGYRIVCSSDQSRPRQRFTVAHELAHVILERTGRNAPRSGRSVERICDRIAAECLMPTAAFERLLPWKFRGGDVVRLSRTFGTSISATAIRCAELRVVCVFEVTGGRVTWGYGGVRPGAVRHLLDQVRDGVMAVLEGESAPRYVYFYGQGFADGYRRFEWIPMGPQRAVFLLIRDAARAGVSGAVSHGEV